MKQLLRSAGIVFAAACSNVGGDTLPMTFALRCGKPTGSEIPPVAANGFEVEVDRAKGSYRLPWDPAPLHIKDVRGRLITFDDEQGDNGPDGNPFSRRITYDRTTGVLQVHDAFDAYVPVRRNFSSQCRIVSHA